ncbi:MAG TPA: DUF4199 domain-containing protein [Chitinophagaceae bacterium]|nr:DUF4199 domain-containing protein [Chitinophagaceae bacterium]
MENATPNQIPNTHISFGVITGIILFVMFVIVYSFNLYTISAVGIIQTLVFVALVIAAVVSHSKALGGNVTFGDLFASGFKAVAIATLIILVCVVLFDLLVPTYKTAMVEMARQKMVLKNTPQDQIDAGVQGYSRFFLVIMIGGILVGNLIVGAIASLIGAAVSKKNPNAKRI